MTDSAMTARGWTRCARCQSRDRASGTVSSTGPLIRVPAIAYWPGVIEAGSTSSEPLAFWDWMPTACELGGVAAPAKIDGVSFVPALRGDTSKQKSHPHLFWRFGKKTAIRKGHWKAVRNTPGAALELYDLRSDIGETKDIAKDHPEVIRELEKAIADSL